MQEEMESVTASKVLGLRVGEMGRNETLMGQERGDEFFLHILFLRCVAG